MVKTDFIKLLAEKTLTSVEEAKYFYETFIETIQETIKEEKLVLSGFGTFELKHKDSHPALHPQTGEQIYVEAQDIPTFKFAKGFKEMF